MKEFGFDDANELPWSNEYIEYVSSAILLLKVYQDREEAEPFRLKQTELEKKVLESTSDLPQFTTQLRDAFPIGLFGTSRENSQQSMSILLKTLIPAAIVFAIKLMFSPEGKQYM